MELTLAQKDMRFSYVGGGPGVVISGGIWLIAGTVERLMTVQNAFYALFFGGMLIFPIGAVIVRQIMKRPPPNKGNQLGNIAMESTIAMIGGMLPAYLVLHSQPQWALPLMALAVGTHYFAFATLYGDRTYWILGAAIAVIGVVTLAQPGLSPIGAALPVAITEILLGAYLVVRSIRSEPAPDSQALG